MEKKRQKRNNEEKNLFLILPYYVIVDLLKYYEYSIDDMSSSYQLFGCFKLDRFRKIFQIFNSITGNKYRTNDVFRLYLNTNKIVYFEFFSYRGRKISFSDGEIIWKSLEGFKANNNNGKVIMFLKCVKGGKFTRLNFPVMRNLYTYGSRMRKILDLIELYPKKLINQRSYEDDDSYFTNEGVSNIEELELLRHRNTSGENWGILSKLKKLKLRRCGKFGDKLFQIQNLESLRELQIAHCSNIKGKEWIGCRNLRKLRMCPFILSFALKKIKTSFAKLEELNIEFRRNININNFDDFISNDEEFPDSLKIINLTNFTGARKVISEKTFKSMKSMEKIELKRFSVQFSENVQFPNLSLFSLYGNVDNDDKDSRIILDSSNFPKLKVLDLTVRYNPRFWIKSGKENNSVLEKLSLIGCNCQPSTFECQFYELKELTLSRCRNISYDNWNVFTKLKKLKIILLDPSDASFLRIFNKFTFPSLVEVEIKIYRNQNNEIKSIIDTELMNSLNEMNFRRIKLFYLFNLQGIHGVTGDWLFKTYSFPKVETIYLDCDDDTGEDWKPFSKTLKTLTVVRRSSFNVYSFQKIYPNVELVQANY